MDEWVGTPFESGPAALDDLILRVAGALVRRAARVALAVEPAPVEHAGDPV